ncbi:DEAD/DEAH box helicase [Flammeovirga agarivorans]|uniref:ATP-dependent helicase n=1 Tax=Flammeovirga agarivorans TaxID=2726742 RepID=A0A7X8SQG5_9BACT|nr:DEAD/DEAH box helicase [Flammeovirga agarivorans]NLR94512.1 ATP-dependent helicase [Flammeovirga agarivorans]
MKVSTSQPFQLVYSLFQHQFLGYLFESFVVQLNKENKLTLQHQNISSRNAHEFSSKLDQTDYELITLMDEIQPEAIVNRFGGKKRMKPNTFFLTIFDENKGDKVLQKKILDFVEKQRSNILGKLYGKMVFEMGKDGDPIFKTIRVQKQKAEIEFRFWRNKEEKNTNYRPFMYHDGEKVEFQYKNAVLLSNTPAWLLLEGKLYTFKGGMDGKKIKPFLYKNFIAVPQKMEESYYEKFITHLIEDYKVKASGFEIINRNEKPHAFLRLKELHIEGHEEGDVVDRSIPTDVELGLFFDYAGEEVSAADIGKRSKVTLEYANDEFTFTKTWRDKDYEYNIMKIMEDTQLDIATKGVVTLSKNDAFTWISHHSKLLKEQGLEIKQEVDDQKVYFVGESTLNLEVSEDKDWFDIKTKVVFGEYEIPFKVIRKLIVSGRHEFELPNGEIAVIPNEWFAQYQELFYFLDNESDEPRLHKHHLALVQELQEGSLAKVSFDRKLARLNDFDQIEEYKVPRSFKGKLRPYQKAGYNWMRFLSEYNFGGCLADDMGLGKTVQTLSILEYERVSENGTSLLIMPTSLVYNWEMEAKKFTPKMKILNYTGTNRSKDPEQFGKYDIVITSYGTARIDAEILSQYYFNYTILDEAQTIKNPSSIVTKAVNQLKSRKRLLLSGTPIENTTMDLWSQMNFANTGLLGSQNFFKKEFLNPIERKKDEKKYAKLYRLIKPFIMRRHKSQVASELPEKVEKVMYIDMTPEQKKKYEEVKSSYRNDILEHIETTGVTGSQFMLLKGLTELRQLANHPKLIEESYGHSAGKFDEVIRSLSNAISEGHKILVFSQFVKHLSIFRKELDKQGMKYAYLDGATKDRKKEVNDFQNNSDIQIFLISLKAGGLGLNLTAADYVFILDPWWNPAIEAQAVDRAHRIGQENQVFVYKFITRGTVEEKILALQQSKRELADTLITTEESFMKKLSKDDIKTLLS